ncbi:hypothetical protein EIN_430610 [Entamoeba invadens IP1]|uniref:Uncharacterized protein n=1 Tax=Entamoeba invadens IP1 TaxID=370355 RepID=A0A0A1UF89_ENTIV|nr:hypothetical protein EIN_430610 [Entamoeba invadens IP1]ELP95255.1 hypothetical protein EIN_430610 [Entamoeba invadens IP1]|eukprot:XP_004262026.1 hypothetical protein EIN_430610 [Entamoeba invadens IP1]
MQSKSLHEIELWEVQLLQLQSDLTKRELAVERREKLVEEKEFELKKQEASLKQKSIEFNELLELQGLTPQVEIQSKKMDTKTSLPQQIKEVDTQPLTKQMSLLPESSLQPKETIVNNSETIKKPNTLPAQNVPMEQQDDDDPEFTVPEIDCPDDMIQGSVLYPYQNCYDQQNFNYVNPQSQYFKNVPIEPPQVQPNGVLHSFEQPKIVNNEIPSPIPLASVDLHESKDEDQEKGVHPIENQVQSPLPTQLSTIENKKEMHVEQTQLETKLNSNIPIQNTIPNPQSGLTITTTQNDTSIIKLNKLTIPNTNPVSLNKDQLQTIPNNKTTIQSTIPTPVTEKKEPTSNQELQGFVPLDIKKQPKTTTETVLSLFGSQAVRRGTEKQYLSPEPPRGEGTQTVKKTKTRYTMMGQPLCSYPNCNKTTSLSPEEFCVCSICHVAYCVEHKSELEIVIPTYKSLMSKKQALKPYVLCKECKQLYNENENQHIGETKDYTLQFFEKRKSALEAVKSDEMVMTKGLENFLNKKPSKTNFLFARKEVGVNQVCPVCDIYMNGGDYMNVTCEVCLRKCCIGCSLHTTIAPTLIMGIMDPTPEYVKIVLCKKCYLATRRKSEKTRREAKNHEFSGVFDSKSQDEAKKVTSCLNEIEEIVDKLKDKDDLKRFDEKENEYVKELEIMTNELIIMKKKAETLDKDSKTVMNNMIAACSVCVEECTTKHANVFARYKSKIKNLK